MPIKFYIDWNNDNDTIDPYDEITADVKEARWFIGYRKPHQLIADEPTARLTLINTDGKYTPENSSSPLFGNLLPYRKMYIVSTDTSPDTTLWRGLIEFPQMTWRPGDNRIVEATLHGAGVKQLLDRINVYIPGYTKDDSADVQTGYPFGYPWTTSVTTGNVVAEVLRRSMVVTQGAGWRLGVPGYSELGVTTVLADDAFDPYADIDQDNTLELEFYYGSENRTVLATVTEMANAGRERFWFGRDGEWFYVTRDHFYNQAAAGTVNTVSGDYKPVELQYQYGDHIRNKITVSASPKQVGSSERVWGLDDTVVVPGNSEIELEARLRKSTGQFASAQDVAIGTIVYTGGSVAASVISQGGVATITLSRDGAAPGTVINLTLDGEPRVQQHQYNLVVQDDDSIAAYGVREYKVDLGPAADFEQVETIAGYELARFKDPVGAVQRATWRNKGDGTANAHQIEWTIGTKLRIISNDHGHDAEHIIVGEEHVWSAGEMHETSFIFEPQANQGTA